MSALVRWCLRHRPVVLLATVLVVASGIFGASQVRQQFFPDADLPFLQASVAVPGLSAEQADEEVARPLERATRGLEEVEEVTTIANEGRVDMAIQLAYGSELDSAREDLLAEMEQVELPPGAQPIELEGGFNDQANLNVALSTEGDLAGLTERAEDLKEEIEGIEGVDRVEIAGGVEEQFRVELRKAAVESGQTPAAVAARVRAAVASQPLGVVDNRGARTPLRLEGREVDSVKEVRELPVGPDAELRDLARVRRRDDAGDSFARTNGRPSVSLTVFRADRADEVAVVDETNKVLDGARRELGPENVVTILETASEVKKSIGGLLIEGILGALFAVLVIFAFLRSGRATFVAAMSIPTSIVFGLLAAWALGLSLNIITLAGLTIAIGRVIDDAIVVLENIYKHLERGEPRMQSAVEGTSEVSAAIASSTLATAAVFLPIALVGGLVSEIFLSFSIIVVAALLASFLVAVTVIPVLATFLLHPKRETAAEPSRLARLVTPATAFGLRHRLVTIAAAIGLFAGTLFLVLGAGAVPIQFLPDSGTQRVFGTVELPSGLSARKARGALEPLERQLAGIPGIRDYQVARGEAAIETGDPHQVGGGVTFFATLAERAPVEAAVTGLRRFGEREYPEGFRVQRIQQGPPAGLIEVRASGEEERDVVGATRRIERLLERRPDTVEVASRLLRERDEFEVDLDRNAQEKVDPTQVGQTLASFIAPADAGTTDDNVPIEVRAPSRFLESASALERLPLAPRSEPLDQSTAAGSGLAGAGASSAPSAQREAQAGAQATGAQAAGAAASPDAQGPGAPPGGGTGATGAPGTPPGGAGGQPAGAGPSLVARSGAGQPVQGSGPTPPGAPAPGASPPGPFRIGDVGEVRRRSERAFTTRVNGELAGTVTAKVLGEDVNQAVGQIRSGVSALGLRGVAVDYGGDSRFINEMLRDLGLAMVAAIVLVYFALVLFFGSVAQPITILAPILFSTIGSLLGLILTGRALGLPAMIGQLLLIGIVVANSILLVDTALRLRRRARPREEALADAARLRVRPVLMTAVATIAALTPLALGVSGEGGIISQSLGTVVIGGLLTATVLTLVIVPAVFSLFDRGEDLQAPRSGLDREGSHGQAPAPSGTASPRTAEPATPRHSIP